MSCPKIRGGNDYGYGWPAANEADNFPDLSSSVPDGNPSREDDIVYRKTNKIGAREAWLGFRMGCSCFVAASTRPVFIADPATEASPPPLICFREEG
jgi:hypothetical protein